MKLKIGQLVGWLFLFEIVNNPLREFAKCRDFSKAILPYFTEIKAIVFFLSFMLAFSTMSVLAYLVFHKYYPQRKTLHIILGIIGATIIGIGIRYFLQEMVIDWMYGTTNYKRGTSLSYYYFDNLFYAVFYIPIGMIFFFFQYSKYEEQQKQALELENKKSELSFLKSQINPHFLFNSLNNLYYLVYEKSDNALKSVEKLSNLLRYSLYENEDKVPLKKEIDYLKDFIELERLRFDFDLALDMNIDEGLEHIKIAPFILIPFIENAFKHGALNDPENPLVLQLKKEGKDILFSIKNLKKKQEKDKVGGIGLENVKKRLSLIYGENHILDIKDEKNEFIVNLKLSKQC